MVVEVSWFNTFINNIPISFQLVLAVVIPVVALLIIWEKVFLSDARIFRDFIQSDWKYLGVAWTVTHLANTIAMRFHADKMFTPILYKIEGETVRFFQEFAFGPLTWLLAFAYFVLFPVIILATYFKVKEVDEVEAERYALAYAMTTLLSVPVFVFFPVEVTGHTLPGVEPVLYELHPIISGGISHFDSLIKAFPSLHAGLSLLAAFYAWKTTRTYALLVTFSAILIIFGTFYLGIHWITDALAGAVLVATTYAVSQRIPLHQNLITGKVKKQKDRLHKHA